VTVQDSLTLHTVPCQKYLMYTLKLSLSSPEVNICYYSEQKIVSFYILTNLPTLQTISGCSKIVAKNIIILKNNKKLLRIKKYVCYNTR
jgi:hypothetical protein